MEFPTHGCKISLVLRMKLMCFTFISGKCGNLLLTNFISGFLKIGPSLSSISTTKINKIYAREDNP